MPSIATILDISAVILGLHHALLDFANFFPPYTLGFWATGSISLPLGETTMDISSASPRLPTHVHNVSWDGNLRSGPVFLPHIYKMGPLHWWRNVNKWRLAFTAGHSAKRQDGQWTYRKSKACGTAIKFWGVVWLGKQFGCSAVFILKSNVRKSWKDRGSRSLQDWRVRERTFHWKYGDCERKSNMCRVSPLCQALC